MPDISPEIIIFLVSVFVSVIAFFRARAKLSQQRRQSEEHSRHIHYLASEAVRGYTDRKPSKTRLEFIAPVNESMVSRLDNEVRYLNRISEEKPKRSTEEEKPKRIESEIEFALGDDGELIEPPKRKNDDSDVFDDDDQGTIVIWR